MKSLVNGMREENRYLPVAEPQDGSPLIREGLISPRVTHVEIGVGISLNSRR
jgi:hypothetical protein